VTEYIFSTTPSFEDDFSSGSASWFFDDNVTFDGNDSTFYATNGEFIDGTLHLSLDNNGLDGAIRKCIY
jgi:hypothetical protein